MSDNIAAVELLDAENHVLLHAVEGVFDGPADLRPGDVVLARLLDADGGVVATVPIRWPAAAEGGQ